MTPHTHRVRIYPFGKEGTESNLACALPEGTCVVDRVRKLAEEEEHLADCSEVPDREQNSHDQFARRLREILGEK